jgi:hypothetical protein
MVPVANRAPVAWAASTPSARALMRPRPSISRRAKAQRAARNLAVHEHHGFLALPGEHLTRERFPVDDLIQPQVIGRHGWRFSGRDPCRALVFSRSGTKTASCGGHAAPLSAGLNPDTKRRYLDDSSSGARAITLTAWVKPSEKPFMILPLGQAPACGEAAGVACPEAGPGQGTAMLARGPGIGVFSAIRKGYPLC